MTTPNRTFPGGHWIHAVLATAGVLTACAPLDAPARAPEQASSSPERTVVELDETSELEEIQARVSATPVAVAPVAQQVALDEAREPSRPLAVRVTEAESPCQGRAGVLRLTAPSKGPPKVSGNITSTREALDKRCTPISRIAPTEGATTTAYPPPMAGFSPHFRVDW